MHQAEITRRRAAAFADLSEWFDIEQRDLRTAEANGCLVLIARVSGSKAQFTARWLINRHFPDVAVHFEAQT